MEQTSKFRGMARLLYWVVTVAMLAVLIAMVAFFVMPDLARSMLVDNAPKGLPILSEPSVGVIYALLLISSITVSVQVFIMWHMRALLDLYAEGQALSRACAGRIWRIGIGFVVLPLTGVLYGTASTMLLTLGNPVGERQISIGVSSAQLTAIVGGAMLLLVGVAMQEASKQADENRSFV